MATPATATQFTAGAEKAGLQIVRHQEWATHNRGDRGDGWGPVNGIVVHHFGPYSTLTGAVNLAYNGRSDLPGPLYHGLISPGGAVHMVGWGRVNHAGLGDPVVLKHVISEDYPLPKPQQSTKDGNARFYGFCLLNSGSSSDPYSEVQLVAAARTCAVLLWHHGWTERSVIGHREWTSGKVDPSTSMTAFRDRVRAQLRLL